MGTGLLVVIMELFYVAILHIFVRNYFGLKRSKIWMLLGWLVFSIASNLANYYNVEFMIYLLIFLFFFYLVLLFSFNGTWKQKILITIFVYVLGMLSELAVYILQYLVGKLIQIDFTTFDNFYIICSACSKFVLFVFIKVIDLISNKRKKTDISSSDYIEIFTVPIASFIISYALFLKGEFNEYNIMDIMAISMLVIINLVTYYLYEKIQIKAEIELKNQLIAKQNKYYVAQFEQMKSSWDNLRTFRHDTDKHYLIMDSYLKNKDYKLLEDYFDKLLVRIENQYIVAKTQNMLIDAIINYKANYAKELQINFETNLIIPGNQGFPSDDIAIVLGNILDNAIEATKEVPTTDRRIKLTIKYDIPNLYIEIKNPYIGFREKDISGKYITNKKDYNYHGIGLKTVHSIVEKYSGIIDITDRDNYFDIRILLYNL